MIGFLLPYYLCTTPSEYKSSISLHQIFNIHSIVTYYALKSLKTGFCNENNINQLMIFSAEATAL
jgi:hypothetical protein